MADLVFAAGTSHSPALNTPAEEQELHAQVDRGLPSWPRKLIDLDGNPATYQELEAKARPGLAEEIKIEVLERRVAACQADIDRLEKDIEDADLDALIVVGDDQKEQYKDDNMPAILVYAGETIPNAPLDLPDDAPDFWKRARSMYHEVDGVRDYPVASDLATHLLDHLIGADFDPCRATELRFARGEGHAFGFVHKRLMRNKVIPIVPVALNTYFPPNQPRPRRCYALGRAIRGAVESWDEDARIGILGSGGLSHFTIDEELDRGMLEAFGKHDAEALTTIPLEKLRAGNSEIRNWIVAAGAADGLELQWMDYVPCYRSLAGTGCAMGFAVMSSGEQGD